MATMDEERTKPIPISMSSSAFFLWPFGHACFVVVIFCFCMQLTSLSCATKIIEGDEPDDVLFTRYDRNSYLAAKDAGRDDVRDPIAARGNTSPSYTYDDPNKCTTYLAPSSIPNSGLGMYTTISYRKGETFPLPEIGIVLQEINRHYTPDTNLKLLAQYPWAAQQLTLAHQEVGYGESIIPGLGMLANSHLGLFNMRHDELWKTKPWMDGSDSYFQSKSLTRENDPGRGSYSTHGRVLFDVNSNVAVGEELFVSYGDAWFTAREQMIGVVPGQDHYKEADELLREYWEQNPGDIGGINANNNYAKRNENYEILLKQAYEKDKRLRAPLPNNMVDVPRAIQMGTARFAVPNSIQSIDWLQENGACLDNIIAGVSSIPQAGRGAFATRSINEGGHITTTPVITLERAELFLWETHEAYEDGGVRMELVGHQLLRNYCYGHEDSSLLFFPYSPTVNFINHGGNGKSNAEIRWSKVPYHKSEWLFDEDDVDDENGDKSTTKKRTSLKEMKDKMKTGLMFDIVATRDISRGEEILLDYGKHWEESWKRHVEDWPSMLMADDAQRDAQQQHQHVNMTERLSLPTVMELNQITHNPIVRTKEEQDLSPYPSYIMTRCRFEPPNQGKCVPFGNHCQSRWKLTFDAQHIYPCTILSRVNIEGVDWYTAQAEVPNKNGESNNVQLHLIEYMTRDGIVFTDRPYHKDQYARGVFRHVIGLPDGLMPSHWMDLKKDDAKPDVSDSNNTSVGDGVTESDGGR